MLYYQQYLEKYCIYVSDSRLKRGPRQIRKTTKMNTLEKWPKNVWKRIPLWSGTKPGATVSFMIIIHGQEMTFTNPVLQDTGVVGRQLILVLIFGTV